MYEQAGAKHVHDKQHIEQVRILGRHSTVTKPNSTSIVFVVDRSGSMNRIASDMEGGFQTFVEKQKETPGSCDVSLVRFDTEYEEVYLALPLESVPPLKIEPRGSTALLDAIGRSIVQTGTRLAALSDEDRPGQVVFVIITDGLENASREFGRGKINEMITHQREKYSWEFVFLGANQDAIATAKSIGISGVNAVTYDASPIGTRRLFRGLSEGISGHRVSGNSRGEVYSQKSYDSVDPQDPVDVLGDAACVIKPVITRNTVKIDPK